MFDEYDKELQARKDNETTEGCLRLVISIALCLIGVAIYSFFK